MRRVYFDTSAFSNLWRSKAVPERTLLRVRRRLCSRLFGRRPRFVIGPMLIAEMVKVYGRPLFVQQRAFLSQLPDPLYLRYWVDRIRMEIALLGRADLSDVCLPKEEADAIILDGLNSSSLIESERVRLIEDKRHWTDLQARAQSVVRAKASPSEIAAQSKAWFRLPEQTAASAATAFLRRHRTALGLPQDEAAWPRPTSLPTLWAHAGYEVARIFLLLRDGRKVVENDFADWHHYIAAAYADCFVADDARLTEIVTHCPEPRPRVVSFASWAEELLDAG